MRRFVLAIAVLMIVGACTTTGSAQPAPNTTQAESQSEAGVVDAQADNPASGSGAAAPRTTPTPPPAPIEAPAVETSPSAPEPDRSDAADQVEPVLSPTAAKNQVVITSPPEPANYLGTSQVVTFIAQTNGSVSVTWLVGGVSQGTTVGNGVDSRDITFELEPGLEFQRFTVVAQPDNNGWLPASIEILLSRCSDAGEAVECP